MVKRTVIMEGLLIVLGGSGALAFLFALWLNTRKGKKWLASLLIDYYIGKTIKPDIKPGFFFA